MPDSGLFRKALWCYIAALSFLLISCSNTSKFYRDVDDNITNGNYPGAITDVRQNRNLYGDKSSVLYNLDMGTLFHYAGEYDSSIGYFFAAEKEIEDLYTKSISQQVLSVVVNDNILPYDGEDFEKVLINVFLALDYAKKGMTDDALVEARKVDLKLREYARQYDDKNTYKEDAFIRYITGALYESAGEINDAFISYRNSYEAYENYSKEYGTPAPGFLLDDLVRTARLMSFTDEVDKYQSLGGQQYNIGEKQEGSIIVLTYAGKCPIKMQEKSAVSIPDSSGVLHTFQIALPKFAPRYKGGATYEIIAISNSDSVRTSTELAENITAIAEKSLADRLALIYLKSGGRALLKFLAAEKMKSEMKKGRNETNNFLGSLAIDLIVGATEQADLRGWRTLPAEIQIARLSLPPGKYDLRVNESGYLLKTDSVNVQSGKNYFVIVNDLR